MRARWLALVVALPACASTPGARPHDMSAAAHDAHAEQEEDAARRSEARIAWTATPDGRAEVERLRRMAADHRAASKALRDTEASACANLSEEDRAVSPFQRYSDIASVEPYSVGARAPRLLGARIHFRAVPGLTAPWLQRLIDCHAARIATLGHDAPEMASCPLLPKDVSASVSSEAAGFVVDLKSWDHESAREVLRRARALVK